MHLNNFIDRIISINVTKRNVGKFVRPSRCNVIQNWLRLRNSNIVRKILMQIHLCMHVNAHVISLIWSCWFALAHTRANTHTHTYTRSLKTYNVKTKTKSIEPYDLIIIIRHSDIETHLNRMQSLTFARIDCFSHSVSLAIEVQSISSKFFFLSLFVCFYAMFCSLLG